MIISEQEKNRIRKMHREYSVIKEQVDGRKEKFMTCATEVIGAEKLMGLAATLSEECIEVIFNMMGENPKDIQLQDLMSGGFACMGDMSKNPDFIKLIVENWEPMAQCLGKVDPIMRSGIDEQSPIIDGPGETDIEKAEREAAEKLEREAIEKPEKEAIERTEKGKKLTLISFLDKIKVDIMQNSPNGVLVMMINKCKEDGCEWIFEDESKGLYGKCDCGKQGIVDRVKSWWDDLWN